ncbi:MAG: tartrate dehydrogenase [Nitriliruptoraceae bacterium]
MSAYRIAVIPGDGIGKEVMPPGVDALELAAQYYDIPLTLTHYDWSADYYVKHGKMMPDDALDQLRDADTILFGAVGNPAIVDDHTSGWGLLFPIRRTFHQYINLRPVRTFSGLKSPIAALNEPGAKLDMLCVRENNEGEYSQIGGRMYRGEPEEFAAQESVFTRVGVDRVMTFAFELAQQRKNELTSATKSNGIIHTMPFWDEMFAEVGARFPDVERTQYHIDALAALFILDPQRFNVIVASNLFGDILSDLGAAIMGSIGIAASGNINPSRNEPSLFEPVHGSAPDIAGQGIANPIGQIWSSAMMLDFLGHPDAANAIIAAVDTVLENGMSTPDLGGKATTAEVGAAVCDALQKP